MPQRLGAILAVAFGVSLSVIDGTVANVALPTIGQQLGISAADSIWIVNAYQLAIMVSLLSLSALGDVVGYRKVSPDRSRPSCRRASCRGSEPRPSPRSIPR